MGVSLTDTLRADYSERWRTLVMAPARLAEADHWVDTLTAAQPWARYQFVSGQTGVPAAVIAVIHALECGGDFNTHLHNGDPLSARTVQEPAGRPAAGQPPFAWEDSARDALVYDHLAGASTWTLPDIAFRLEAYNGWGYRLYHPEVADPYLWAGSTHYISGKYTADGQWDPTAVSQQIGAMVLLHRLYERDPARLAGIDLTQPAPATPAEAPASPALPVAATPAPALPVTPAEAPASPALPGAALPAPALPVAPAEAPASPAPAAGAAAAAPSLTRVFVSSRRAAASGAAAVAAALGLILQNIPDLQQLISQFCGLGLSQQTALLLAVSCLAATYVAGRHTVQSQKDQAEAIHDATS